MLPDEPTGEDRLEELDEDNRTPFRPADDVTEGSDLDDTHPSTDSGIDSAELYDEGISGAAEVEDPEDQA